MFTSLNIKTPLRIIRIEKIILYVLFAASVGLRQFSTTSQMHQKRPDHDPNKEQKDPDGGMKRTLIRVVTACVILTGGM